VKLIIHELTGSGITQSLIPDSEVILAAVRPHIYRHNWPTGSIKIQVLDESDVLLAESEVVDIADIGTQNFFHGYVQFNTNVGLRKDTLYKFKVVGLNGYSFSEASYCGVCNDFDLRKYPASYDLSEGLRAPLDIELWSKSTR